MASLTENPRRRTDPKGNVHRSVCLLCEKPAETRRLAADKLFAFCSRRCKLIDLGKWFDGEHRISTPMEDDE